MPPPSKMVVTRAFFSVGLNLWPGAMVNSQDAKNDKVQMEATPAGLLIVGPKGSALVPYSHVKCMNLE